MIFSKDICIISVGRMLIAITGVVSIRLLTTFLSPVEVGRMNIVLAVYGWMNLVVMNPICLYVNRHVVGWNIHGVARKHLLAWLKSTGIIILMSVVLVLVVKPFLGIGFGYKWLILLVAGNAGFTYMLSCAGILNILKHRFWFIFLTNLSLWTGLFLATLLVMRVHRTAEYWILGQVIGYAVVCVIGVIILFKVINKDNRIQHEAKSFSPRALLNFVWPLSIVAFLFWCQSQGYRFIFQRMVGLESLGLFAVGFGIGSGIMLAFDAAFNQYYHPIFYNEIASAEKKQRADSWNKYIAVFLPAVLLMVIFIASNGIFLTKVLTGDRFHQIGFVVFCGAAAEGIRMVVTAVGMVSHSELEMKPLIVPSIIGTVTTFLGLVIFIRFNVFLGAGLSIVLGWLLTLFLLYNNMKRLLPIQLPWKRTVYSFLLGSPLVIVSFIFRKHMDGLSVSMALVLLVLTGIYIFLGQFLLARKWLYVPFKLKVIDDIEYKINLIYNKVYDMRER